MSKRFILAHKRYWDSNYITDRTAILFNFLVNEFNFKILHLENYNTLPLDTEVVFLLTSPWCVRSDNLLEGITKNTNIILYSPAFPPKLSNKYFDKLLERSDMILINLFTEFASAYPQYLDKTTFFPLYFAPDIRYTSLTFNENPIMRCLLPGCPGRLPEYPLRKFIASSKLDIIDILPWYGVMKSKKMIIGDAYAQKLNSYFACVTTDMKTCVIAKHFEIPASGSLLLCHHVSDLDVIGFKPYEHYVPFTKENVLEVITECFKYPEIFNDIRKNGMNYVRKNHSINNRMELIRNLLWKRLS